MEKTLEERVNEVFGILVENLTWEQKLKILKDFGYIPTGEK